MNESKCANCKRIIYKVPCPYCGCEDSYLEASVFDEIRFRDMVNGYVVSGSSEVAIEKDGKIYVQKFGPNVSSSNIVDDSLEMRQLKDVIPNYLKDQLAYNIETLERYVKESLSEKVSHEHSFKIDLKLFSYTYTRKIEKSKK